MTELVDDSGLSSLPRAKITTSGDCSAKSSRDFWMGTQTECSDGETAHLLFESKYNVFSDLFAPYIG